VANAAAPVSTWSSASRVRSTISSRRWPVRSTSRPGRSRDHAGRVDRGGECSRDLGGRRRGRGMTARPRIAVLDEIGEVGALVDDAVRQVGGRNWVVHDYAALGRLLDEVPQVDIVIVATDTSEVDDFKRLAVIHE